MKDVARAAGVSPKTVSNVLNGYPHLRPETRDRVLEAIADLGYEMNTSARGLRQGRTRMVNLALPELRMPYFAELAESVVGAAEGHGLSTLVSTTGGDRTKEQEVLTRGGGLTDGLILVPQALRSSDLRGLRPGHPVVLIGEGITHTSLDRVTPRNVEAAEAATRHLLDGGCRTVALVGADRSSPGGTAALRLQGHLRALAGAGLPTDDRLLVRVPAWTFAAGAEAVDQLLGAAPAVDGIFCLNDALAIGALYALRRHGVRIPEQVAVIGFDDTDEAVYSSPSLTSVAQGREEIARRAVELLVARIEAKRLGTPAGARTEALADFHIEVRESTRAVAGQKADSRG